MATAEAEESSRETATAAQVSRFLGSFHSLLRAARLYQKNHPRLLESLESAEHDLRSAFDLLSPVAVGVDQRALIVAGCRELPPGPPGRRGELRILAEELSRRAITSLVFLPQTNLGELDLLVRVLNGPRPRGNETWAARLTHYRIAGIRINVPIQRRSTHVLAGLVAALLARGDSSERAAREIPSLEETPGTLRFLARLVPALEAAERQSPHDTARGFHELLGEVDRRTVTLLVGAMARHAPREGENPSAFAVRMIDSLLLETAHREFEAGRVKPAALRELFERFCGEWMLAATASGSSRADGTPTGRGDVVAASPDTHAEQLLDRFWKELSPRGKSAVLHGDEAWCVPVPSLREYLEKLAPPEKSKAADAAAREARLLLLNYARGLEAEEGRARKAVAAGLAEMIPLIEKLWPHSSPGDLNRSVVRALGAETSAAIAGLLAAVTENLARMAVVRGDFAEFERILQSLEGAPHDPDHLHLAALAGRLVADDRWLLLVDAALANRPLDPALPRLVRRDPERLLDRLSLLLTSPRGLDMLPAMARLVRAVGEHALGALEMRLFEPRRQRATAAVKLLSATRPDRLIAAIPKALPSWEWSLQDLAVSELVRETDATLTTAAARAFLIVVTDAHPLVAPMMLDHIGIAQEKSAVPLLLKIAGGEPERMRDIFIRIKAVEALGRMRAAEATDLLRAILRERNGLTHAEPSGLRAAAEEALARIEHRPSSARVRGADEALAKSASAFARPRRYLRVPLDTPLPARIEGLHSGTARVHTISLGGALVDANSQLSVGDSIRVEIRAGLRRIQTTAVVRNLSPHGSGVEFVHMKQEDRERLRRLMRRLLE